jgi:hypothetical protein
MTTTVYGASDDLIELDGDIYEEFSYRDDENGDLLGFSDGTLLRIRHDAEGIWRITPVSQGPAFQGVQQAPADDDRNYTDRATLGEVAWVLHGSSHAKASKR